MTFMSLTVTFFKKNPLLFLNYNGKHYYSYEDFTYCFLNNAWKFILFEYVLSMSELRSKFQLAHWLTAKFFSMSKRRLGFSSRNNLPDAV